MKTAPFLQALLRLESNPGNPIIQILIHDLGQGEIPIINSLVGANICLVSTNESQKITGFRLVPMLEICDESASGSTIYFDHLNDLLRLDGLVIHVDAIL